LKDFYFWIRFPLFSAIVAIFIKIVHSIEPQWLMPHIWLYFTFYLILIPGIYLFAIWGAAKAGERSVSFILASEILKMVLPLILAAIDIFKFHPSVRVFGFNFFILYILFSSFEIHCLLHNLRLQKK
jgi:hypothetical protein